MKSLVVITVVLLIAGLSYLLHRLAIHLEEKGYIYYRKKSSGGRVGSAFMEVDKLTRPSIVHVVRAQDHEVEVKEHDGE